MSAIKTLFSQTIIYGISTIFVRMLNWILTPFYTRCFDQESAFGVMSNVYSYIALLNVLYMYGMETSFFRFATDKEQRTEVFKTINGALIATSISFSLLLILFAKPIASYLEYPNGEHIVVLLSAILLFDNISNIPFAFLRIEGKSMQFMLYKLLNVSVNILVNLFLLLPAYFKNPHLFEFTGYVYDEKNIVNYVFIANLVASIFSFLLFAPQFLKFPPKFNKVIFKPILSYSMPLVLVGLAGMVNEVSSRLFLERLLTGTREENLKQVGIYSAVYKLSIFMTIAINGFKMGAEPFFFKHAEDKKSNQLYADVLTYFSIACLLIFLSVNVFSQDIVHLLGEKYRVGIGVLPILLLANFFLGVYYNISIWYRLTDLTIYGSIITVIGAFATIVLNVLIIPTYGYWGSAMVTCTVYFLMCVLCYYWGQKHFHVPYDLFKIGTYMGIAIAFTYANIQVRKMDIGIWNERMISFLFVMLMLCIAWIWDIQKLKKTRK